MLKLPSIKYNFVGFGQQAPKETPFNTIWVDVGGMSHYPVFDHHNSATRCRSATELVAENAKEIFYNIEKINDELVFVTHNHPDLDAIAGIWLVTLIIRQGHEIVQDKKILTLIDVVNDNDQGICRSPFESWFPVIFRLHLDLALGKKTGDSLIRLLCGMNLIQDTYNLFQQGVSLVKVTEELVDAEMIKTIKEAQRKYKKDYQNAKVLQLHLPVDKNFHNQSSKKILVDGLFLPNPQSVLFKELARTDNKRSSLNKGFTFLVVSRPVIISTNTLLDQKTTLFRFIISVDPMINVYLYGLGQLLKEAENYKRHPFPLQGNYDVKTISSWYDGKGHNYTIIDSPSYSINGFDLCGSLLTASEVLEIVHKYGCYISKANNETCLYRSIT